MSTHSRPASPSKSPPSCSSSSSSSSSSLVRDDTGNVSDRSRLHVGPGWVDPRVCEVSSSFYTDTSVADFLNEVPVLKASAEESLLAFGPCSLEDCVYKERSSTEPPFFFMYSCLFADLHVSLPFDAFTAGVLKELNVAPTQLHPNSWVHASISHCMSDVRVASSSFLLSPLLFIIPG